MNRSKGKLVSISTIREFRIVQKESSFNVAKELKQFEEAAKQIEKRKETAEGAEGCREAYRRKHRMTRK